MTLQDTQEGRPRTETMQDGDICFTHKDTEQRFLARRSYRTVSFPALRNWRSELRRYLSDNRSEQSSGGAGVNI